MKKVKQKFFSFIKIILALITLVVILQQLYAYRYVVVDVVKTYSHEGTVGGEMGHLQDKKTEEQFDIEGTTVSHPFVSTEQGEITVDTGKIHFYGMIFAFILIIIGLCIELFSKSRFKQYSAFTCFLTAALIVMLIIWYL